MGSVGASSSAKVLAASFFKMSLVPVMRVEWNVFWTSVEPPLDPTGLLVSYTYDWMRDFIPVRMAMSRLCLQEVLLLQSGVTACTSNLGPFLECT